MWLPGCRGELDRYERSVRVDGLIIGGSYCRRWMSGRAFGERSRTLVRNSEVVADRGCDALRSLSIAVRIRSLSHCAVGVIVVKQSFRGAHDSRTTSPDKSCCARPDRLGTLSLVAQDENRFAECGCLLLDTTRVSQDQVGRVQKSKNSA